MPSIVSIYQNRLSITPARSNVLPSGHSFSDKEVTLESIFIKDMANKYCWDYVTYEDNFTKPNHPFSISKSGKKKIMDSVNALYRLSAGRTVLMKNGKFLYNFKCAFVTLTLPSSQNHSDIEIKKKCLNQFLIELRKHYGVNNYLWKAELQQNENIHFHLVIDRYVDYQALRRRWNRIVNKLGYLDVYTNKMKSHTIESYHKMRLSYNQNQTFQNSKQAYEKGVSSGWKNANSVDIKCVKTEYELASYMSKYITKEVCKDELTDELLERQSLFGRSWYRSQSLSKLKMSFVCQYADARGIIKIVSSP
ncbi:MAG: hypothetical protein L3J54_04850 [Draconibacterium sp.]|nr:hypothetical protein [Draconibacterium sp.]